MGAWREASLWPSALLHRMSGAPLSKTFIGEQTTPPPLDEGCAPVTIGAEQRTRGSGGRRARGTSCNLTQAARQWLICKRVAGVLCRDRRAEQNAGALFQIGGGIKGGASGVPSAPAGREDAAARERTRAA